MNTVCIRALPMAIALALACPLSVTAQIDEQPGDLVVAVLPPFPFDPHFCGALDPGSMGTVTVYGILPDAAVTGVRFSVRVSPSVIVLSRSILGDAIDASAPGDDEWILQFPECTSLPGGFQPLVQYNVWLIGSDVPELCLSSNDLPRPEWASCDGGTITAHQVPAGFAGYSDGCFVLDGSAPYCVVGTGTFTWGTIKGAYSR